MDSKPGRGTQFPHGRTRMGHVHVGKRGGRARAAVLHLVLQRFGAWTRAVRGVIAHLRWRDVWSDDSRRHHCDVRLLGSHERAVVPVDRSRHWPA